MLSSKSPKGSATTKILYEISNSPGLRIRLPDFWRNFHDFMISDWFQRKFLLQVSWFLVWFLLSFLLRFLTRVIFLLLISTSFHVKRVGGRGVAPCMCNVTQPIKCRGRLIIRSDFWINFYWFLNWFLHDFHGFLSKMCEISLVEDPSISLLTKLILGSTLMRWVEEHKWPHIIMSAKRVAAKATFTILNGLEARPEGRGRDTHTAAPFKDAHSSWN